MSKVFITDPQANNIHKKEKRKKNKIKRCALKECRKKLRLTDTACRCQQIYCPLHRLPEMHTCSYNFKSETEVSFMKRVGLGGGEVLKLEVI